MKTTLMTGIFILAGSILAADFTADFQTAKKLMNQKKYAEAAAKYQECVKTAPNADLKDQCLTSAAEMYIAQKKYAEAEKGIAEIKDPAAKNVADMKLLTAQKKYQDILTKYGKTDFSKYPTKYALSAYELRGKAGMSSRRTRAAGCEDLYKAASLVTGNEMKKAKLLGDIMESSYWQKDTVNLRKAGKGVIACKVSHTWGIWLTANGYLAEDALKESKTDETIGYADSMMKNNKNGLYYTWGAYLKGQALVKKGKKDEAKKLWTATLANPQNKCRYTSSIDAALKTL